MGLHVFVFSMCRLEILHVCIASAVVRVSALFAWQRLLIDLVVVVLFAACLFYVSLYLVSFPLIVCSE